MENNVAEKMKNKGTFTTKGFWASLLKDMLQEAIRYCALGFVDALAATLRHHFQKTPAIAPPSPSPVQSAFAQPSRNPYYQPPRQHIEYPPAVVPQSTYNSDTPVFNGFGK